MDIGTLVSSFFTVDGPGGIFIVMIIVLALIIYAALIRWILAGGKDQT